MTIYSKLILYQYNVHVLKENHLEFSANASIIKLYLILKLHIIVLIFSSLNTTNDRLKVWHFHHEASNFNFQAEDGPRISEWLNGPFFWDKGHDKISNLSFNG